MTNSTPPPDQPSPPAPLLGHECIQAHVKTLDGSPGVYRMLDAQARVLYVGKARNLKARVSNYARPAGHSARISRMIRETASMMFLTTRTETEALLLEQNLIKQLKPKYNVLLRDDKSFPNILVAKNHGFPQIKKHRGAKKESGAYFGPFASAGAVNAALVTLLIPPSAILLGTVFLHEVLEARHLLGMGFILCGLICVDGRVLRRKRH